MFNFSKKNFKKKNKRNVYFNFKLYFNIDNALLFWFIFFKFFYLCNIIAILHNFQLFVSFDTFEKLRFAFNNFNDFDSKRQSIDKRRFCVKQWRVIFERFMYICKKFNIIEYWSLAYFRKYTQSYAIKK